MSGNKLVASFEAMWAECLSSKSLESISVFCIKCREQVPCKFLFKTRFQKEFFPYLSNFFNIRTNELIYSLQKIKPMIWVANYLASQNKIKQEKFFHEVCENTWNLIRFILSLQNDEAVALDNFRYMGENCKIVSEVVALAQSLAMMTSFSVKHEERVEAKLAEITCKLGYSCRKIEIEVNGIRCELLTGILSVYESILKKSKRDWNEKNILTSIGDILTTIVYDLSTESNLPLVCDRHLKLLEIINILAKKQKKFGPKFISSYGEKLKVLFLEFIRSHKSKIPEGGSFYTDSNQLAQLFLKTFTFFKSISKLHEKDPSAWNIPLIIFHMVLSSVIYI